MDEVTDEQRAEAASVCGSNDTGCVYDYLVTGDQGLAQATKMAADEASAAVSVGSEYIHYWKMYDQSTRAIRCQYRLSKSERQKEYIQKERSDKNGGSERKKWDCRLNSNHYQREYFFP